MLAIIKTANTHDCLLSELEQDHVITNTIELMLHNFSLAWHVSDYSSSIHPQRFFRLKHLRLLFETLGRPRPNIQPSNNQIV
jgi:hypothetical protein